MKKKERERQEAIDYLKNNLKIQPGEKIFTKLLHCSRSGMYRVIDVYIMRDNEPWNISELTAKAIGARYDYKRNGVGVGGCGMDMGFHVVYTLSYNLFKDGFICIGEKCPSNDHCNGDKKDYTNHTHKDGGYALKQVWF